MTDQPFLSILSLYAAHTKNDVGRMVVDKCIDEENSNLNKIIQSWLQAAGSLRQIETQDSGATENCETSEISSGLIGAIKLNPAIKYNFSRYVTEFKMVEIDNLVSVQREISLDYVDELTKKIPKNPSEDDLLKFCLIPEKQFHLPKFTRKNSNSYYFTSPSSDLRFLGSYVKKELTRDDVESAKVNGFPTHAIMLFVGYGAEGMNAYSVNGRLILTNGFHRAYALRRKGIKKIPLVIRKIGNADSEFPDEIRELKKDYLLKHPRPILMKDFFNDDLIRVFKMKKTTMVLNVNWDSNKTKINL